MKRIKIVILCFGLSFIYIIGRLFYVGIVKNEDYTKSVMAQRTSSVTFKSPRGIIYDRNMIRLTDAEMRLVINNGKPYYVGDRTGNLFSHVIGYISPDGKGSGIEGAFDYVLSPGELSTASYLKDIYNNKISRGYSIDVKKSYGGISLTADYHIQQIAEEAMDSHGINGAVIVANCETGEILAMASRPSYDADNLVQYLKGTDGELLNKATLQYNPGSVFKIVVAAAFLENHYNDEFSYECTGETEIDGINFVCHKEGGHGVQNLEQAFANSCNCAFYSLGAMVGIEGIYDCAKSFGIGEEVLKINGISEYPGFVPHSVSGNAELANVSIGQGDVMVTPLQIADMLCTICNGGVRNQLSLVRGIVNDDGMCMETEGAEVESVLSETTARRLVEMMNLAVLDGTGKNAYVEFCGSGGKTGSAETGWKKEGVFMQQGWFAGYFPAVNPRYVCVIIAENGNSGSESACPVFRQIGNTMRDSGY